jgi:hypothetical protein
MQPNPYESPPDAPPPRPEAKPPNKLSPGRYVLAFVLILLIHPAIAIAGIATCAATYEVTGHSDQAAMVMGFVGAGLGFAGMIYLVARTVRRPK